MADLSDFEEDAVEMISQNNESPAAVMRFSEDGGVEMLMHNGDIQPGPDPQLDLLAAYVIQISQRNELTVPEVFDRVDDRLSEWSDEGGIHVGEEER